VGRRGLPQSHGKRDFSLCAQNDTLIGVVILNAVKDLVLN